MQEIEIKTYCVFENNVTFYAIVAARIIRKGLEIELL